MIDFVAQLSADGQIHYTGEEKIGKVRLQFLNAINDDDKTATPLAAAKSKPSAKKASATHTIFDLADLCSGLPACRDEDAHGLALDRPAIGKLG